MDLTNLSLSERIFLTATQPETGQIEYIEVHEHEGKKDYLIEFRDWRPLITGLVYPTHTAYDFGMKMLYVCDCDKIRQFEISFQNTNGEDIIYSIEKGTLV